MQPVFSIVTLGHKLHAGGGAAVDCRIDLLVEIHGHGRARMAAMGATYTVAPPGGIRGIPTATSYMAILTHVLTTGPTQEGPKEKERNIFVTAYRDIPLLLARDGLGAL